MAPEAAGHGLNLSREGPVRRQRRPARLDGVEVQVFGVRGDANTRAALRFFAERRIRVHFVDFDVRGPAVGELRRFAQRLGIDALIDRGSRRFAELGLGAASYSPERWMERLTAEPRLLRMPLARWGNRVTIGRDEKTWREWKDGERG